MSYGFNNIFFFLFFEFWTYYTQMLSERIQLEENLLKVDKLSKLELQSIKANALF